MPDKRRPVLVLTRDAAIPVLRMVLVAPITRKVRGITTEVPLNVEDGMPEPCAASLDNLTLADKAFFTRRHTVLPPTRMHQVCAALRTAVDC
jgi:mRNA interferase MazF